MAGRPEDERPARRRGRARRPRWRSGGGAARRFFFCGAGGAGPGTASAPRAAGSERGRAPRAVFAAAFVVLAAAGVAVVDDYGVTWDEHAQIAISEANWRYIAGVDEELSLRSGIDVYYGVAFELPLLLLKEALGLADLRHFLLLRHAASHAVYLAAAVLCGLLARRLVGSSALALFAVAVFALQPRLYAHSFFNSKDIPTLALFAACLWLAWRAFRRDTAGAFLLCGACAAALVNLRIAAGLAFAAVVAAARGLDILLASGRDERRRAAVGVGAFAAALVAVFYAISPWLWADPGVFAHAVSRMARHPLDLFVLFQGEAIHVSEPPARYFPVWFAVSTPPVAIAFGLCGAAFALRRGFVRPGAALRNTPARFVLLLAVCWAGPISAAALLEAHAYNGWRHLYFIAAPFCVLAVLGLRDLARAARRKAGAGGAGAVHALAAAGVAAAALSIVLLHPRQQVYFNLLEDRTTPHRLRDRYEIGYWGIAFRTGIERALGERPGRVCLAPQIGLVDINRNMLPRAERERIVIAARNYDACDFAIGHPWWDEPRGSKGRPAIPPDWTLAAYGSSVLEIFAMDRVRAHWRRAYESAALGPPEIDGYFAVHRDGDRLVYVRDECAPEDVDRRFVLRVTPADASVLPERRRRYGFDDLDFDPVPPHTHELVGTERPVRGRRARGIRLDGLCVVSAPLPGYEIARIVTGQRAAADDGGWRAEWRAAPDASPFDVRLRGGELTYFRDPCAPADTQARFALHVTPVDPGDLPGDRKRHGFDNLDFAFAERGSRFDGKCVAVAPLPDYPIAGIDTGQFTDGGRLWRVRIDDVERLRSGEDRP